MNDERFREIYQQYYGLVKKTAFSVLKDYDFSEDVAQEVFLFIFVERTYFKGRILSSVAPWKCQKKSH